MSVLYIFFVRSHISVQIFREELVEMCLEKGTELVQAVANALFVLPSTEDVDGPIVKLPPPVIKLPREKHVKSYRLIHYYVSLTKEITFLECLNRTSCTFLLCIKFHS